MKVSPPWSDRDLEATLQNLSVNTTKFAWRAVQNRTDPHIFYFVAVAAIENAIKYRLMSLSPWLVLNELVSRKSTIDQATKTTESIGNSKTPALKTAQISKAWEQLQALSSEILDLVDDPRYPIDRTGSPPDSEDEYQWIDYLKKVVLNVEQLRCSHCNLELTDREEIELAITEENIQADFDFKPEAVNATEGDFYAQQEARYVWFGPLE